MKYLLSYVCLMETDADVQNEKNVYIIGLSKLSSECYKSFDKKIKYLYAMTSGRPTFSHFFTCTTASRMEYTFKFL